MGWPCGPPFCSIATAVGMPLKRLGLCLRRVDGFPHVQQQSLLCSNIEQILILLKLLATTPHVASCVLRACSRIVGAHLELVHMISWSGFVSFFSPPHCNPTATRSVYEGCLHINLMRLIRLNATLPLRVSSKSNAKYKFVEICLSQVGDGVEVC